MIQFQNNLLEIIYFQLLLHVHVYTVLPTHHSLCMAMVFSMLVAAGGLGTLSTAVPSSAGNCKTTE